MNYKSCYAQQFYPFWKLIDIQVDGSYWKLFYREQDNNVDKRIWNISEHWKKTTTTTWYSQATGFDHKVHS